MLADATTLLASLAAAVSISMTWSFFSGAKWNPSGRHCYITGGSTGLGLALAVLLTRKGADVSIVARNEEQLAKALAQLEAARVTPNQILKSYSYSLNTCTAAKEALEVACEPHGGETPDAVFLCAGKATPGFFIEETEESMKKGMDNTYWLAAWSAMAASQRMIRTKSHGKIIFVSSVLGYMSMFGYSTYAPGKHAIRGLAEGLRQELLLYSIGVHIYFPATIFSPGYVEENKTKPRLLLEMEESDGGVTPEQAAQGLYKGIQRGDFHITDTFIGDVFRTSTRGATPQNGNFLKEAVYGIIGYIALPFWRRDCDQKVVAHRPAHEEYLTSAGVLSGGK
ncbi:oxidoreductase [Auriscalpium vulgare]|uniref:Oxidoreductase n=1 Tax=Auriscalpium vulgare TaxID=40419 RepID=A0ACB8S9M0_9AGAM|nr:oxidoreductase [Auriscalpium vulgare]